MVNWAISSTTTIMHVARVSLLLGLFLFIKLEASLVPEDPMRKKKRDSTKFFDYGMAILVGFSYGLPFVFFVVQQGEMKF
nr:hypothetical protein CFP56_22603 [Quercus suber]